MPPLRDREGDVGYLLDTLLEKLNAELGTARGRAEETFCRRKESSSPAALARERRELEAALLRAFIWSRAQRIDEEELRDALLAAPRAREAESSVGRWARASNSRTLLKDVAQHYLSRAMEEAHGNKTEGRALVGFASYQTLKNWLGKYEVEA